MKYLTLIILVAMVACSPKSELVMSYNIDANNVIDRHITTLDNTYTSDDNGSIKIDSDSSQVIKLYETGDIDLENCQVIYEAMLKTKKLIGTTYLEMWCVFGDQKFFSRALNKQVGGSNDWQKISTPFLLKKGQNPDNIELNLVVDGVGTVWIDNIKLKKVKLE